MKRTKVLLVKYFFLSLILASYAQADEADEVHSVIEKMAVFIEQGDLEALGAIYAPGPGVHIIEGTGVNHGWEDYRDHHLQPELQLFQNLTYRYFAIEPLVKGSLAYAGFQYELTADTTSGKIASTGRGTAVLEKMDGKWRVVHMHTSGRRI